MDSIIFWVLLFFAFAAVGLGCVMLFAKFYRKVEQGKALIVNKMGAEPDVTFTGMFVMPVFHKAEVMDISIKAMEIDRKGTDGLICKDNIRADVKVTFFVRVNKTAEDAIKVAQSIGCARASDTQTLEELFNAKFSEALKTVGKQLEFVDLYTKRDDFRDQIIQVIGRDLNGYVLDDAAIDYLEQTPLEKLDENNILDAQGIRKITELTAIEKVRTNEYENNERKQIKKQDVEAQEAILELERQQADAEAKQQREIETVRAREQAETLKIQAEETLKSENARIRAEEEISINEENKQRQVQVAEKNRERVIAVETERVEKDRQLEVISREREVDLQRIAKDKEVEREKKEIADVIRERIAVEKTVAEEEERIKKLRVVEEAERTRAATVIAAEAEAQEALVKDIKAAEASEEAAKHKAREEILLADASLEAADRQARAKIRLAEGVEAEVAAPGLAEIKVKEADAVAIEKVGRAEATILAEKGSAQAKVVSETGAAEANVVQQKGVAEGEAIKARLTSEATGLAEKATAMRALDEAGRGHEEYRLQLDKDKEVELTSINARQAVAEAQARMLAEALSNAKIDIVGGENLFVDRLVNAVSMGKSMDGFVDRSNSAQTLLQDYLSGKASLPEDLREVLTRPALDAKDVSHLTVSALLARLLTKANDDEKGKVQRLLDTAKSLGIDNLKA